MANSKIVIGEHIWVKPFENNNFTLPIGCKVVRSEGKKIIVKDDDQKEFSITIDQVFKNMHVTSARGVEDMITLGNLQEYTILRNLHLRYHQSLIYTYTGSMLVAINPYEILPIYTGGQIELYREKKIGDAPPHIFAIGDACYRQMIELVKNQCIVISGESGAGKTESTKLILQYLATVSGKHSWIEQQIQETNPILEAFGNAKTVRNDNSSRFGKYININFNSKGFIENAKIEQYLLEKSRIVFQNQGERNYHIFYCLLAGLNNDERKKLELTTASDYEYLKSGKTVTCDGRRDASDFADVRAAMKVLNFSDEDTWSIFKLLATILHFGNLKYKSNVVNNMESAEIADNTNASRIASFLGINKSALCDALTRKTIQVQGERVVTPLTKQAALESRDSFVKAIYGQIFIRIVEKINETIYNNTKKSVSSIGVLDIFGFENFTTNSFEQLCINYANENLQQFFVKHIFKMEQEEYKKENIEWVDIEYKDNQDVLQMIGLESLNIMSLIDEETRFPKGTDLTLLTKLHSTHGKNEIYLKPKSDHSHLFGIQHFAGNVFYETEGFLDKNRDTFSNDVRSIVKETTNIFLKSLFTDAQLDGNVNRKQVTLSLQFRSSLDTLMKTLSSCHPFFIRCIKPNEFKKPKNFDRSLIVRQLRYAGMMETAKIRSAGYPIRHNYFDFVNRYRILAKNIPPAHKTDCKVATSKICQEVLQGQELYQLGNTKVFLKNSHDAYLEEMREEKMQKYILILQKNIRRWICRRRYLKLKEASIALQKHWRARGYRSRYLTMRRGYLRLQAVLRSRQVTAEYQTMKHKWEKVQALFKGYLVRKMIKQNKVFIKEKLAELAKKKQAEIEEYKSKTHPDPVRKAEENHEKNFKIMYKEIWDSKKEISPSTKKTSQVDVRYVEDVFGFLQESNDSAKDVNSVKSQLQNNVIKPVIDEELYEDLSEYDFRKFAATYFTSNSSYHHSRKALKRPLLEIDNSGPFWSASKALWIALLRFMGDLPEPREAGNNDSIPVMSKLTETLGRAYQKSMEFKKLTNEDNLQKKLINMTLKKHTKLKDEIRRGMLEDDMTNEFYDSWLNSRRTNNLEKLHFIIGHGILMPELRDEIYCQLCKQLTNNPSKASHARGWILMSLCVGCFGPSDLFCKYLRAFIRDGPPGYAPYCEGRLNRTLKNGSRSQPPSWIELQATKSKAPLHVNVMLMDGTSKVLEVDSATTADEMCSQIAENIGLTDLFGFSIFINLFDKVLSLGSEGDHVMDAISQCEQFAHEQGVVEKNAPWKLFFRKEIFTPWHNPAEDQVSTSLIYHQIIKGVKFGEYRCSTENDIAMLAAQQYYIEYNKQADPQILHKVITNYIPNQFLQGGDKSMDKWEKLVKTAYNSSRSIQEKVDPAMCKEDIVIFAKLNWPILFSRFYEAIRIKGSSVSKDNVIIAVNWTGIYIVDDQESILLELSFVEISYVGFSKDPVTKLNNFTLITVLKEELVFQSLDAEDLSNLIIHLIDGLKKRSLYVVAQNDYKEVSDASSFLELKKGDLITLVNDCNGSVIMTSTWGNGECNGRQGLFPADQVYILPTLTKPPQNILIQFKKEGALENYKNNPSKYTTLQRKRMYTLQKYAQEYFRSSYSASTVSKVSSIKTAKQGVSDELWKHGREPLKLPLLRKIQTGETIIRDACNMFLNILKYMGDMPAPRPRIASEFTDEIFSPALKSDVLKDEVYCQIMKQLTNNRIQLSEERGWELMWLATGLFSCSQTLMKELTEFLDTRPHPIAKESLKRIFKIQKLGQRQYPPYLVEVEAIQHRSAQIYHKVYFPDDTDEAFEVDSSTKAKDLSESIADRLNLKNSDGFNLFVKIANKVFSVPDNYFFFDFIHELVEWIKESRPQRNAGAPIQIQYQIFFMKKLWIHTIPGKDINADQIFYFPQELPKFLRGYHKCNINDAVKLAALIYRTRFANNYTELMDNAFDLQTILPTDVIRLQNSKSWRKQILSAHAKDEGKSPEEAKEDFLKIIYEWPTFGTAFFDVKQTTDSNLPEIFIIGINKNGVNFIHQENKNIIATYGFSDLSNWSSGHNYFHISLGNIIGGSKILCETSLGYKMDDLISSYINYMKKNIHKNKSTL